MSAGFIEVGGERSEPNVGANPDDLAQLLVAGPGGERMRLHVRVEQGAAAAQVVAAFLACLGRR